MSTEAEITAYLATQGLGTAGTDLFYGPVREFYQDAMGTVQLWGGLKDEPNLGDNTGGAGATFGRAVRLEYPKLQVLFRGAPNDYDGPRLKADQARNELAKVLNTSLSGTRYVSIETNNVRWLKMDENFRHHFIFDVMPTKGKS